MQGIKRSVVIGAGVVTLGVGGLGVSSIASADTSSTTNGTSIVDKLASKFNLDKSQVQAVFDQDRASHESEMKQARVDALKQAVTDGKLSQVQADHITATWAEIDKIRATASSPKDLTDTQRTEIKSKMDALRTWAKDQQIDVRSIGGFGHGMGAHGGHRGGMMGSDAPDSSSTSSSTTAS